MFKVAELAQNGVMEADEQRIVGERDAPPPRETTRRLRIQPELRREPERIHDTFVSPSSDSNARRSWSALKMSWRSLPRLFTWNHVLVLRSRRLLPMARS